MSESFVFYHSFREAVKLLPKEDRLEALEAIIDYGLYGECQQPQSNIATAILMMAIPQIDANNKRRDAGKTGGRPSKKPMVSENDENEKPLVFNDGKNKKPLVFEIVENEKPLVSENVPNKKPNVNVNVNVNDNVNGNGNSNRFTPPTIEQVRAYCDERKYHVDPERFVDFYASKGWMVGKNKMKSWKACVRNWERQDKEEAFRRKNAFTNYDQRDIDYDAIEAALISKGAAE